MNQEIPYRLKTGIDGLDTILDGGLLKGSVYIVHGFPGTGKTILANQACFHHAGSGGRSLYITVLSESHDRMVNSLRQMDFYDEKMVSESIYYLGAYRTLETQGMHGVLKLITQESRERNADFIVLDGLFVIEQFADSTAALRLFINELSTLAHIAGATILLLTVNERGQISTEYAMVDGSIELAILQRQYRPVRFVQVHKTRGSGFVSGQHMLDISTHGVTVYPRMESLFCDEWPAREGHRKSIGIASIDEMLDGGIQGGTSTLIVGPTGVGKTNLGLCFIDGSTREDPGLIFSFYENTQDISNKSRSIGLNVHDLIEEGIVRVIWKPPIESTLDKLGYHLLAAAQSQGATRVLVDGIEAFQQTAVYPDRLGRFLTALAGNLRAQGITTLFTLEMSDLFGAGDSIHMGPMSALAENIILLKYARLSSRIHRIIAIIKARNSPFDSIIRKYSISSTGITLEGAFEGPETNAGRLRPGDAEG